MRNAVGWLMLTAYIAWQLSASFNYISRATGKEQSKILRAIETGLYPLIPIVVIINAAVETGAMWMRAIVVVIWLYFWWKYPPDDDWRKRLKDRATGIVKSLGHRLVVAPAGG